MDSMTHFQSILGWRSAARTFQPALYSVMRIWPASWYQSLARLSRFSAAASAYWPRTQARLDLAMDLAHSRRR